MQRNLAWVVQAVGGSIEGVEDLSLEVQGVSTDTRTLKPQQLYIPLVGDRFDGHDFLQQAIEKGARAILWQEDHPLPKDRSVPLIQVKNTLAALQQLAHVYRNELSCRIVAVTGSNGKTASKDLISAVLSCQFRVQKTQGNLNNHIGVPLTLLSLSEETEIAVVEMGMNHQGEIALLSRIACPDVAVITNIGESHIEYLGSRAGIADAKLEILEGLHPEGCLIYDGDEPLLQERVSSGTVQLRSARWDQISQMDSLGFAGWKFRLQGISYPYYLSLLGKHNVKNALLAIHVGTYFQCDPVNMGTGLASLSGGNMRLEKVIAKNGMHIINDTYNASPTSVKAGLDLLQELEPQLEKWALLGDIFEIGAREEIYHKELGAYAVQLGISRIYTVGEKGKWIADGAEQANRKKTCWIEHFQSLDQVSDWIHREGNENVLLLVKASRAASLDEVVKKLVEGV